MVASSWLTRLLAIGLLGAGAPSLAADDRPPITVDGVPDLNGTWTNAWLTRTERPKEFTALAVQEAQVLRFENGWRVERDPDPVGQDDSEWNEGGDRLARIRGTARSSWIYDPADGKIPYTAAAKAANKARAEAARGAMDNPEQLSLRSRCMSVRQVGPPLDNLEDLNVHQIVQTRDQVAIVGESNPMVRIIQLGGKRAPNMPRQWFGDSIGHWEGRTLVVETIGFHPAQVPPGPIADAAAQHKVVERFTRTGSTEIHYAFTVENPAIYTQRWRGEMVLRPASGRIFEYACHEGNYALANILAGGRAADAEAAKAKVAAASAEAP